MNSPLVVAIIGILAAALFSHLGRSLRNYSEGKESWLSMLSGSLGTLIIYIVGVCLICSVLITSIVGGGIETLLIALGAFFLFSFIAFTFLRFKTRN